MDLAAAREPERAQRELVRAGEPARLRPDPARPQLRPLPGPRGAAERRPSAWIEPKGEWGQGRVELVEIPTNDDTNDNVVTLLGARAAAEAGRAAAFAYTLSWFGDDPTRPPAGRVLATRRDARDDEGAHRFVIDFAGGICALPPDNRPRGVVTIGTGDEAQGEILEQQVRDEPA